MMSNLPFNTLSTVQTVIGKQSYQLEVWTGRTENSHGYEVDEYEAPVTRKASVQPVSSKEIKISDLQANAVYIKIYDVGLIDILSRSDNPDRITYKGYYWQPISPKDDWNDWNKVYCARQKRV